MIRPDRITYHISGKSREVFPGSSLWHRPLPGKQPSLSSVRKNVTVGAYLTAARTFLLDSKRSILPDAVAALRGRYSAVSRLAISLEKHGAYYHPLKIIVSTKDGDTCRLVLNGAVSRPGLDLIPEEYRLLAKLGRRVTPALIPKVFGQGRLKNNVAFFLGEWFDGFYEFHVSRHNGDETIAVWGPGERVQSLSYGRAAPIYRHAAYILASYYDIRTGEGIFPWHHAAGDFIVDPVSPGLSVRLIALRGYRPMVESDEQRWDPATHWLPALLFFFLGLMLRMRLDRLDGTGETAFLKSPVLKAALQGFFKAMACKVETGDLSKDLHDVFRDFLLGFSPGQLKAVSRHLVGAWHPGDQERAVIRENLAEHTAGISRFLKNM